MAGTQPSLSRREGGADTYLLVIGLVFVSAFEVLHSVPFDVKEMPTSIEFEVGQGGVGTS